MSCISLSLRSALSPSLFRGLIIGSLFFLFDLPELLAQGAPAADLGAAATPSFGQTLSRMLPMFVIIFFIFYFLVIRPQEKKLRAQQNLLAELKKGESVVTSSGIIGRIASIEEDSIHLDLGGAGKLRIEKSHIVRRYKKEEKKESAEKPISSLG